MAAAPRAGLGDRGRGFRLVAGLDGERRAWPSGASAMWAYPGLRLASTSRVSATPASHTRSTSSSERSQ
jgi:hypothetical protein